MVCHVTMQLAGANALYNDLHEAAPYHDGTFKSWSKERTEAHPFHYRDGVRIWMAETDVNPDDDFLS